MNLCDDNRIITIEKAKQALIKGTNIEDSPEEMKVLDSFLLRCWQMGWLDRYAPTRHFNAMPKVISERMAAGHGSNVPMQPNITPMPSNTSNALKALNSVNATQSNALDCISRKAAIEAVEFGITYAKAINKETGEVTVLFEESNAELQEAADRIKQLPPAQPLNQDSIETQSSDLISRQAALELCDWYDNPSMREDLEKLRPARFSTDTISRQAAIETVMECYDNAELFEVYEEKLRELPPAQPESDSGRWERHYSRPGVYADLCWHCSKCGYKTDYQYANVNHHYCPNCGRKMEREVSDE